MNGTFRNTGLKIEKKKTSAPGCAYDYLLKEVRGPDHLPKTTPDNRQSGALV